MANTQMPFPKIEHCLICEDIRPESSGLSSLLGFYGIAPHVKIHILDFSRPVPRLTLFFLADEVTAGGNYQLSIRVLDPNQKSVLSPEATAKINLKPEPGKRLQMAINMLGTKFSGPGTCKVFISVDGSPHFNTAFQLIQGSRGGVGDSSSGVLLAGQIEGDSTPAAGE